ncbi:hypothetical protein [Tritonibacter mobilis]|nr:hypothetical protein [Rhodobacteraceae bacterium G21628-S1]
MADPAAAFASALGTSLFPWAGCRATRRQNVAATAIAATVT